MGDYFRSDAEVLNFTDAANELIAWLRSKTLVLALLRDIQVDLLKTPRTVLRAVITRWTAHYQAYKRLLELHTSLEVLTVKEAARPADKKMVITGDAKAQARSRKMLDIIRNPLLWHALAR